MTTNIQVYADVVNIVPESKGVNVLMTGIDPSQIAAEFNAEELLETMELSTIERYLTNKLKEEE